jgi:integrase
MAAAAKITDAKVKSLAKEPGRHALGEGLYLNVTKGGAASFLFRYRLNSAVREMGLGSYPEPVSLKDARAAVADARKLLAAKVDPLDARKAEPVTIPTFGVCADEYVTRQEKGMKSATSLARLKNCLENHAKPIRALPVNEVDVAAVMRVLEPLWYDKPETATKLRGYIEAVLDAAAVDGHRDDGRNPAAWRGVLKNKLTKPRKLVRGHHKALPFDDVPAFVAELREREAISALALEFIVLTAVRTGEARFATWAEIDLTAKVWTIPAPRMKSGVVHRVPLCARAVDILKEVAPLNTKKAPTAFVFPGRTEDGSLSENALLALLKRRMGRAVTVHGFRSAFRDFAGDRTSFPREVAEQCLAHAVGDDVERAYRRSDALDRRRKLMDAWARHCEPRDAGAKVVSLHAARRTA